MRMPRRGEKGFTLIELLIVVAILGVLAAVVIPNVGRFIGRGEDEAKDTELSNIQAAVTSMMVDNSLSTLTTPATVSTNDMTGFPDTVVIGTKTGMMAPNGIAYDASDKAGFILFGHDVIGGDTSSTTGNVNYVATNSTAYYYDVDSLGTVVQYDAALQ